MPSTQLSPYFDKDPGSTRLFGVDWQDILALKPGVTLTGLNVTATAGITVGATSVSGTIGSVLLSGGTAGTAYDVAFAGTFSNGEIDVQHIIVTVKEIPVGLP